MHLLIRALVTWLIEAVALLVLDFFVPGLHLADWETAFWAALVIGLLNASVRPAILLLAMNLGMFPFAVIAFVLNAVMVLLAQQFVPGFQVDGLWTALVVSFGLAALNTAFTGLVSLNDDDSFYRNVVRYLARRNLPSGDLSRPGTVIIQIDGLAEPILRREIESGGLPTLARWLEAGTHRLVRWECGIPSMTSASQAGILHGNCADIPAFRWYDKVQGRLIVSNHPTDARWLEQRQSIGQGLLREEGTSLGNLLAGSAERSVMTMAALTDDHGKLTMRPSDFSAYLVNPYNLTRGLGALVREFVVEYWEAWQQRRHNVQPRMHRGGWYPLLRAVCTVIMHDATIWSIIGGMYAGRRIIYGDLLGYDEVAHHAGPATEDALRVLRRLDRDLRGLESAARGAPRPYQFVLLSDHGQSFGATFRQRYGLTLDQLIHQLLDARPSVSAVGGEDEGWGRLNVVLSEAVGGEGRTAEGAKRLLRHQAGDYVQVTPPEERAGHTDDAEVVVCASGNLALVYFTRQPGRLSLEQLRSRYPGLVDALARHEGIGFLVVYSEQLGHLVLGRDGWRNLDTGEGEGADPLQHFSPYTAAHLRKLSAFANVPDIVVNSLYDPATGQVAAFEELIGCHGGAGGLQTEAFLLYPTAWTAEEPELIGAEAVHAFLSEHALGERALPAVGQPAPAAPA